MPAAPPLSTAAQDLSLSIDRAEVVVEGDVVTDTFFIHSADGSKITDEDDLSSLSVCLMTMLDAHYAMKSPQSDRLLLRPSAVGRANDRLLHSLMDRYLKSDVLSVQESIIQHVEYSVRAGVGGGWSLLRSRGDEVLFERVKERMDHLFETRKLLSHYPALPAHLTPPPGQMGRSRYRFDNFEAYQAASLSVRDRLIESWNDTNQHYRQTDPKRVYYLSMEFLMGRSLLNSLLNLQLSDTYSSALGQLGYDLETLREQERDAALGNGGLGRLAACFLDSMATLNLPAWGYGLRYQYGMFRQALHDGFQREQPDYWLNFGNPWEVERPNVFYPIKFYGHVSTSRVEGGRMLFKWHSGEEVIAVAYDTPVPGWRTPNTNNLRLWSAKPAREFDLESVNPGDYVSAILSKQRAETISSVLYPDDRTYQGKELRLKQQFFMVSATLQDILRRFREMHPGLEGAELAAELPRKIALQLNDTHPTIGVAELMRLLMDELGLGWTAAWEVTTQVFSFTNHTVLPEALEKWPVELVESLLPRHMQIIYDINWRFCQELQRRFPDDLERLGRMSIIEEGDSKCVRMAHLALAASHTVNGVAAIHSELIKTTIFKDFYALWPHKFQNKTNGVTQRRWLAFCNPPLRALVTEALGTDSWIGDLELVRGLRPFADDPAFLERWAGVKQAAKVKLAACIESTCGLRVSPHSLFDIQVKRIHEYKRQLLNVLGIIHRYSVIKAMTPAQRATVVPRVVVIGGKAAPGYDMAKRIIKLVNAVGDVINSDAEVGDLLKVRGWLAWAAPGCGGWSLSRKALSKLLSLTPPPPPAPRSEGVLLPRLQRERCGAHHPGCGPEPAHQHGRDGGERHQQHEVRHERWADPGHHGRGQRGDCGGDWGGEHLHLRPAGARGAPRARGGARLLDGGPPLLRRLRAHPRRRLWLARLLCAHRGWHHGGGLLPAGPGLRLLPGGAGAGG